MTSAFYRYSLNPRSATRFFYVQIQGFIGAVKTGFRDRLTFGGGDSSHGYYPPCQSLMRCLVLFQQLFQRIIENTGYSWNHATTKTRRDAYRVEFPVIRGNAQKVKSRETLSVLLLRCRRLRTCERGYQWSLDRPATADPGTSPGGKTRHSRGDPAWHFGRNPATGNCALPESLPLPGKHRSHQLIRGVPQGVVDPLGFADRDDIADQRSDLYQPPGDQAACIV